MVLRKMFLALAMMLTLPTADAADARPIRVLAFGDSLTEGYGLRPDEGLVPRLQEWLQARGHDVVVLNGGLSGDTTAGGRVRIGYSIARHHPDATIVELGGNDMLAGFSPKSAEANLDSILRQAGQGGTPLLLVGIANPRASARAQRDWTEIWPRLAARHDALLHENLYAPLVARPKSEWSVLLQADGVHASAQGVERIVEALGPKVEELLAKVNLPDGDS